MDHLKAINQKARRIEEHVGAPEPVTPTAPSPAETVTLHPKQPLPPRRPRRRRPRKPLRPPHPPRCSLVFAPGWEVDSTGGTAGLCQPVERDLFDCHLACFWPAHVPDQLNHAPDWTGKCASAQKDWRKIDLIFP